MIRLAYLPLAIWAGAMACAVFTAFRAFGELSDEQAGDLLAGIFHIVDYWGIAAAGLAAAVSFSSKPRFVLAIVLGLGAAANVFWISPQIAASGERDSWHRASEMLWTGLLLGALILAALGPPRAKSRAS